MENLKLPAYPIVDTTDKSSISPGFTKLELAALIIDQGLIARFGITDKSVKHEVIAARSVALASAVLEEANK